MLDSPHILIYMFQRENKRRSIGAGSKKADLGDAVSSGDSSLAENEIVSAAERLGSWLDILVELLALDLCRAG